MNHCDILMRKFVPFIRSAVLAYLILSASSLRSQTTLVDEGLVAPPEAIPPGAEVIETRPPLGVPLFGNWFNISQWDGSFEVGLNGTQGNVNNFNFRVGLDLKRKTEIWENSLNFVHSQASVEDTRTQDYSQITLKSDRRFAEGSRWSWFNQVYLLRDSFRPFDLRLALNTGVAYRWVDTDTALLKTRFGAGASREIGGVNNEWVPEAVFGADFMRQITARQKISGSVDYYPQWNNFADFRATTNVSWEYLMDEAANLSLKLSVIDNYDSTPDGAKPNDLYYALLLLWKM